MRAWLPAAASERLAGPDERRLVAGEVRTLAQRSAVAAKEIKELIETSVSHVAAGSQLVAGAGATMDEIVRSVKRVSDIMGEIASASADAKHGDRTGQRGRGADGRGHPAERGVGGAGHGRGAVDGGSGGKPAGRGVDLPGRRKGTGGAGSGGAARVRRAEAGEASPRADADTDATGCGEDGKRRVGNFLTCMHSCIDVPW